VWINPGDLVLISLRDFQEGKADIILKYTPDEGRSLKSLGEISETVVINEQESPENQDIQFEFDSEDIDDI
jgi:translation initiation factor 1A